MTAYLVDYENTKEAGLLGYDLLSKSDTIDIFFSNASKNIRKNIIEKIKECGCEFSAIALVEQGRNNLDRYISVRAGELYAKGTQEIAIISKDKGFCSVIDAFEAMNYFDCRIIKADTVENAMVSFSNVSDGWKRRMINERNQKMDLVEVARQIKAQNKLRNTISYILAESYYVGEIDNIVTLIASNGFHYMGDIYIALVKKYGKRAGCLIYNSIKNSGVTIKDLYENTGSA